MVILLYLSQFTERIEVCDTPRPMAALVEQNGKKHSLSVLANAIFTHLTVQAVCEGFDYKKPQYKEFGNMGLEPQHLLMRHGVSVKRLAENYRTDVRTVKAAIRELENTYIYAGDEYFVLLDVNNRQVFCWSEMFKKRFLRLCPYTGLYGTELFLYSLVYQEQKRNKLCSYGRSYLAYLMGKRTTNVNMTIHRLVRKGFLRVYDTGIIKALDNRQPEKRPRGDTSRAPYVPLRAVLNTRYDNAVQEGFPF